MWKFLLLFYTICSTEVFAQSQILEVGIPSDKFPAHAQEKSNWCWAACIQMALEYDGVYISQSEIVYRTFGANFNGELPNLGGSVQNISSNLNGWEIDIANRQIEVASVFFSHPPSASEVVYFLEQKKPIYISYKSSLSTNHAILIISCRYIETSNGLQVIDFTAVDPWPSSENVGTNGIVTYNYSVFYPLLNYFWIITTKRSGHVNASQSSLSHCSLPFCSSLLKILEDYDNNFDNLKGQEIVEGRVFRSKIKFPNEISSMISDFRGRNFGQDHKAYPSYVIRFYKGFNTDSSRIIFDDLKANFELLNIKLEESSTGSPHNNYSKSFQNRTIHIHFDDERVVTLKLFLGSDGRYNVVMHIQSEYELEALFQ